MMKPILLCLKSQLKSDFHQVAQTFSWVSMGLIVLSVATFIAETMPKFRADLKKVRILSKFSSVAQNKDTKLATTITVTRIF